MMLLVDAGNSRIKSALYGDGVLTPLEAVATKAAASPMAWRECPTPGEVRVSSVAGAGVDTKIAAWIRETWGVEPRFAAVHAHVAGVHTRYDPPRQLGVDRWLAAIAGFHIAAGAACVIDAGTALTVDIVDAAGHHLGGSISPGVNLMVDSLTRNTAHLRIDRVEWTRGVATNTVAAISNGCIDAVAGGIERVRRRVDAMFAGSCTWFVTGGDAGMIIETCAGEFRHEPELVLHGLVLAMGDAA